MDDWKKLIRWSLQRWYIYAASFVVCGAVGFICYRLSPSTYKVHASIMLRQQSSKQNAQDQLIGMMGYGDEKSAIDEVEVLTSSSLLEQVVERLNFRTLYYVRESHQWKSLYPDIPFALVFPDDSPDLTAFLTVKDGTYTLRVEDSRRKKSEAQLTGSERTFKTHIGDVRFEVRGEIKDGKYRILHRTPEWAVQDIRERVSVSRSSRESQIIHLSSTTADDLLMRDVLGEMLTIYHRESASDKNIIARETELFLNSRIEVVAAELDSMEAALEAYKRAYRIANLDIAAESYRSNSDSYNQRVAKLDADLSVLDFMVRQLNAMGDDYTVLPSNMGISDGALAELVSQYNKLVLKREKLRQTALPGNPSLDLVTAQVSQTHTELLSAIGQARQSTMLVRENTCRQRDSYAAQLQANPEQERRYQEMLRERNAKEKQYNFLVESREENTLLLASDAMPVKIIERPTIYPKRVSPKLPPILLTALLLGFMLPVVWFFLIGLKGGNAVPAPAVTTKEN